MTSPSSPSPSKPSHGRLSPDKIFGSTSTLAVGDQDVEKDESIVFDDLSLHPLHSPSEQLPQNASGYVELGSNRWSNRSRLNARDLHFPVSFGPRERSWISVVLVCVCLLLVVAVIGLGALHFERKTRIPRYEPDPLHAVLKNGWLEVSNADREVPYRFPASQLAFEARNERAIERRSALLDSGNFKIFIYPLPSEMSGEDLYKKTFIIERLGNASTTLWEYCLSSP